MRIILIGFMGSGKTTLAKELSTSLGYKLCDMDAMIEEKEQCSITSLFKEKGEMYFREVETQLLESLSLLDNIVVASGGGTPCSEANSRIISDFFVSIFLDVEKDLLVMRLKKEYMHRPLLASTNSIEKIIESLLNLRKPYYEKATYVVQVNENSESNLLQLVLKKINHA